MRAPQPFPAQDGLNLGHIGDDYWYDFNYWSNILKCACYPSLSQSFPMTDAGWRRASINKQATRTYLQNIPSQCSVCWRHLPGAIQGHIDFVVLKDKCGHPLGRMCGHLKCTHNSTISITHLGPGRDIICGPDVKMHFTAGLTQSSIWFTSFFTLKTSNVCFTVCISVFSLLISLILCSLTSSV